MRFRTFETALVLPQAPEALFPFFADAANLEAITPPWLRFRITTPSPIEMRVGTSIDYRLRLRGVPIRWRTRIEAWDPPLRFVDRQERGPYRLWRHEHVFERVAAGTRMIDRVAYAAPGGVFVERLLVRRDVARIFAFRAAALAARFGAARDDAAPGTDAAS